MTLLLGLLVNYYFRFHELKIIYNCTPSKQNRVAIVNEGIRCKNVPFMSDLKNRKYSTKDIEASARKIKKSGCYKSTLYKFRYDVVPEYNLWTFRDNMSTFYFPYDNAEISAAPK